MTTDAEHIEDDTLQRFFDGEATEGEAALLASQVETPLEAARLARLERLGDLVRLGADETMAELSQDESNALFDGILGGIEQEKKETPRLRLIKGQQRKQRAGVAAALAIAIAAAVALAFYLQPPVEDPTVADRHPFDTDHEVVVHDLHHVEVHAPGGSEVEDVDFGGNTGTIFQVPGEHGQPLAVVWIDDEEATP